MDAVFRHMYFHNNNDLNDIFYIGFYYELTVVDVRIFFLTQPKQQIKTTSK